MLCPTLLLVLSRFVGLDRVWPAPLVYFLGITPAIAFPAVNWTWPVGLVILAMIAAYEMSLIAGTELNHATRQDCDYDLAARRARRISLVLITVDAHAAAGIDTVLFIIALVAIVRLGRLSVPLATLAMGLSFATFLKTGDPSSFFGLGSSGFSGPDDVNWFFTLETLLAATALWGETTYRTWRRAP